MKPSTETKAETKAETSPPAQTQKPTTGGGPSFLLNSPSDKFMSPCSSKLMQAKKNKKGSVGMRPKLLAETFLKAKQQQAQQEQQKQQEMAMREE